MVSPVSQLPDDDVGFTKPSSTATAALCLGGRGGTAVLVQAEHGLYSPISVDRPCLMKSPGTLINGEVMVVDSPLVDVRS